MSTAPMKKRDSPPLNMREELMFSTRASKSREYSAFERASFADCA